MAIDTLDGTFPVPQRDEIRDATIAASLARVPELDGSPDGSLWVEASAYADVAVMHSAIGERCARDMVRDTASTESLDALGAELDCPRLDESKSTGFAKVRSRSGGGLILAGTEIRDLARQLKFTVLVTGVYQDLDPVPIQSLLTGTTTNLPAGTELRWTTTPVGFSDTATVYENTDGSGMSGGSAVETNEEYNRRISDRIANPPQAGNCAEVVKFVEKIRGIGIAKAYCYPAVRGPGSYCVAFTMRPSYPGASRLPNGAQIAIVEALVKDAFPGDDSIFCAEGQDDLVRISYELTWASNVTGWANIAPWPSFTTNPVLVDDAVAISASALRVHAVDAMPAIPTVGKSIGLYNATTRTHVRKTIATVTEVLADHTYDLAFDMLTPGASDLSFAPADGAIVSPWSDSLPALVAPTLAYVDRQGPGEQVASFGDEGLRQRRFPPPSPDRWPSRIESRLTDGIHTLGLVSNVDVVEPATLPDPTAVGTPGTIFNLHRVSDIGVFAE